MAPPAIDTSVARSIYSTKAVNDASAYSYNQPHEPRQRSLSTASTSSSLSLVTPDPSSGNPSSSSLYLPSSSRTQGPSEQVTAGSSTSGNRHDGPSYAPEPYDYEDATDPEPEAELQDEYVIALHDFVPKEQNATCIPFRAGERIRVLNRDRSGWWDGEIDGRRGWFPSNYVTKDISSLTDEKSPSTRRRRGHGASKSDSSSLSRANTASPGPDQAFSISDDPDGDLLFPAATSHTPPIMLSLLHSLQLLQNTTLARRISHYQPSVACIIQCIRSLLQATECLPRDAPVLRRFSPVAQARKRVLSELALLVSQAKKASGNYKHEEQREADEELMLRLAGQLFARTRRFLAVAVQHGIELPEKRYYVSDDGSVTLCERGEDDQNGMRNHYGFNGDDEVYYPVATVHRKTASDTGARSSYEHDRELTSTPSSSVRTAGSGSGDSERGSARWNALEEQHSSTDAYAGKETAVTSARYSRGMTSPYVNSGMQGRVVVHHRYRSGNMSISSSSSFSSSSSMDSPGTPMTPPFPEGPCNPAQVQQALRLTHDNLLSTIAAFIGHVHSHSRSAHASSTGHLYALVKQIVDIVCKLLTIVDAVMNVKDVPWMKISALENAKEHLYQMACALADSVREMATNPNPLLPEEEERGHLLKAATDALKAGSDCVSAVKTCLARPLNAAPFIIVLPAMSDGAPLPLSNDEASDSKRESIQSVGTVLPGLPSSPSEEELNELHEQVQIGYATTTPDYEEDDTIQPTSRAPVLRNSYGIIQEESYEEDSTQTITFPNAERDRQQFISALNVELPGEPIMEVEEEDTEDTIPSPDPGSQTDTYSVSVGDATTWEGSHRAPSTLEEKLINGVLPAVPEDDEDGNALKWALGHDYAQQDVAYNSDGFLVGATLGALVEKMTPHDQIVDATFSAIFFMTFRLFATPVELAETLIDRFSLDQPQALSDLDTEIWRQRKQIPVRLRVLNFLKLWLESYWRKGTDDTALPLLLEFVRGTLTELFAVQAARLEDIINLRQLAADQQPASPVSERYRIGERLRDAGMPLNPPIVSSPSEIPRPIMTKALLASLRAKNFASIAITDFDALELARQLTAMECSLYCAITPEEMLEIGHQGAPAAVNIKAVSSLSTAITGWVAESILDEPDLKKRILLVKFFIKVADRCTSLNNFSTPRSILAALDSSTISRLRQTWTGLAQKNKIQLEALRKLADHARNYHEYRSRLRNTAPPAVPFLGLYLTDLTFCREGNPSHRASPMAPEKKLLNFNKYHKLARIVQDMQRFQVPYNLKDIPEARQYLQFCLDKAKDHGDLEDLYRRSQLLEPKQPAETPTSELRTIFGWGSRSQGSNQSSSATIAS